MKSIEQIKNAIALVKENKAKLFKEFADTNTYYLNFSDSGHSMWFSYDQGPWSLILNKEQGVYLKTHILELLQEQLINY